MSLLLDALKRAEEAKRERDDTSQPPDGIDAGPLSLEPLEVKAPPEDRPPITRNDLPHISQTMGLLDDELGTSRRRPPSTKPDSAEAQRSAQQVFAAKTPAYSPRRPFFIALAGLGVFALAAAGYFWYQLQPSTPATIAQAPPQPAKTAAAPVVFHDIKPPEEQQVRVEIEPEAQTARVSSSPEPSLRVAGRREPAVALSRSNAVTATAVEQGYQALQQADFASARSFYGKALAADPANRDALLGLAAVEMHDSRPQAAEALYRRVLAVDPRDPYANAALTTLRGSDDPAADESRLRNLLTQQPESSTLNFALGNLYATQGRWPEAQAAYFKAHVGEPENADYTFNLAISLDHLRQNKAALDYYRKALSLASRHPGRFDPVRAQTRIDELGRL